MGECLSKGVSTLLGSRIQSACWERMGTTPLASYWLEVSVGALYMVQVRFMGTGLSGYGCEMTWNC